MLVCEQRDRAITYEFCLDFHLTILFKAFYKQISVKEGKVGRKFFQTKLLSRLPHKVCCFLSPAMETIQYRKSRIWEMKEDERTKSLSKNQLCAIFSMRDIWRNVLPKLINLCMEILCWCTFKGYKYGRRKPAVCL